MKLPFEPGSVCIGVGKAKEPSARHYQSLLDSSEAKTRAELVRHPGLSRARITQVLKQLEANSPKFH